MSDIDQSAVDTIRVLSIEAVERARSGHPGMPLGAAPMAHVVWSRHLRFDPSDPGWPDRDRFVLSAGHGSMLLYSLLHLAEYDLPMKELQAFRQWGSRTPGHPEAGHTPGVEVTTGPLGQGFANGVGLAIAEAFLAATFARPGHPVFAHHVYAIVSDGDLMEGVASEAASFAGHLGLGRLVYLYDDNHITIEGSTDLAFSEDVETRFTAYGWQVLRVGDGNDLEAIDHAIREAKADEKRPSLIMVRTHIGYGSPNKQDSSEAHGAPLGADEVALTKERLGWSAPHEFYVPDEVRRLYAEAAARGAAERAAWQSRMAAYAAAHPAEAETLQAALAGSPPYGWADALPVFTPDPGGMATRSASGKTLQALAQAIPTLLGGSADLAPSNNTLLSSCGEPGCLSFSKEERRGRNLHFGVREHAMGAVANGMALHGGMFPYCATFLVFADYMRPAIRLAALKGDRVTFVFTHDSVGVGEDGPTHQPVEHVASLRVIPGLVVIRPADANETSAAWGVALGRETGPVALILTRQNVPVLEGTDGDGVQRGGYILREALRGPYDVDALIMATGSEVGLAVEAQAHLEAEGLSVRVVSLPSFELFDEQEADYRESVLPAAIAARVAVEAGVTFGWERYVGPRGTVVGIDRFGASAPGPVVMRELGITAENVVAAVRRSIGSTTV